MKPWSLALALLVLLSIAGAMTPPGAINRLTADLKAVLDKPEVQEKLRTSAASIATYMAPREFAAYVNRDFEIWGKVIRDNNIKPN